MPSGRLSNYENGEVTVSILNDDEPLPNPDAYELSRADTPPMPSTGKQGNGMRRYGLRQTTRRKQRKEWVVTIQRHNLIKTVKAEASGLSSAQPMLTDPRSTMRAKFSRRVKGSSCAVSS